MNLPMLKVFNGPLFYCGVIALLLFSSPLSFSAEQAIVQVDSSASVQSSAVNPIGFDYGAAMLRTGLAFLIVIALLVGLFFGIKWLQKKSRNGGGGRETLSIVGTLSLGPKRNVALIRIVNRILVVGISEGGIALLTELSAEEADAVLQSKAKSPYSFSALFARQLSQLGKDKVLNE
jgi:flagellar protein FliO/FliZ